jgi:hypothetical protein
LLPLVRISRNKTVEDVMTEPVTGGGNGGTFRDVLASELTTNEALRIASSQIESGEIARRPLSNKVHFAGTKSEYREFRAALTRARSGTGTELDQALAKLVGDQEDVELSAFIHTLPLALSSFEDGRSRPRLLIATGNLRHEEESGMRCTLSAVEFIMEIGRLADVTVCLVGTAVKA